MTKCTHCRKAETENDMRYCHPCYIKFLKWLEEGGAKAPESIFSNPKPKVDRDDYKKKN